MRLLHVEDNARLAQNLAASLRRHDFVVDHVSAGTDAVHAVRCYAYDAVILDLGLPDMDGLDVLRDVKKSSAHLPVIICTARDALEERIRGLDGGADDYLVKPFEAAELIARIRAVLRRPGGALGVKLTAGNIILDSADRSVRIDGETVRLSRRELALLELFLRRRGRVLSKEAIEDALYGFDEMPTANAIEVVVHRLRKKLHSLGASATIHTLRGIGYLMEDED